MFKSLEDLIEPGTDDDTTFSFSLKPLQFIYNVNYMKIMINNMKTMTMYKLEVDDINDILDKHFQSETRRTERNETRKI